VACTLVSLACPTFSDVSIHAQRSEEPLKTAQDSVQEPDMSKMSGQHHQKSKRSSRG